MSIDGVTSRYRPDLDERWLLRYIRECPEVLGLGDLVLDEAHTRCSPGRLELVLHDPYTNRHYDVALQAGATYDRHFLRVVEFWAAGRRRTPRRSHCAVLIAEEVGPRFLRIAGLLIASIPLVVVRMEALPPGATSGAGGSIRIRCFTAAPWRLTGVGSARRARGRRRRARAAPPRPTLLTRGSLASAARPPGPSHFLPGPSVRARLVGPRGDTERGQDGAGRGSIWIPTTRIGRTNAAHHPHFTA